MTVVILISTVKIRKVGVSLVKKLMIDGFGICKGMKPFTTEDELKTHD
jgi:hypothetical protein